MQMNTWTPPVRQNNLPRQHQTLARMQFGPTPQMGFYGLQQNSFDQQSARLSKTHIFSEPTSSSAHFQTNQSPKMWSSCSQTQWPASTRHPPPNIVHHASLHTGQIGTLTINLNNDSQFLHSSIQRNYKDLHSMQNVSCTAPSFSVPSVPRNVNSSFGNSPYTYGSIRPWPHHLNRQYNGVQTVQSQQACLPAPNTHVAQTVNMNQGEMSVLRQHNEMPSSVANFPVASHIPVNSLLPLSSQMCQSQNQNRPCQLTPCRKHDNCIELKHCSSQNPSLQYRARLKSAIQNQSNQRLNKASPSIAQEKIKSQTGPVSSHYSQTKLATYSAIQSTSQPETIQSNNTVSALTTKCQDIPSFSTSTSQTTPTSGSGFSKYSHNPLLRMLLKDNNSQLTSYSNSFGSQYANSKSGLQQLIHDNTAGHITTGKNYTRGKVMQVKEYQEPAKKTHISRGNEIETGSLVSEPQKSSQIDTNWKKGNEQVQSCVDQADSLKPGKKVRQANKAVAVVPPISQQALIHGQQNHVITITHESLPLKTSKNVSKECENMEKEKKVQNVTFKLTEDLPHVRFSPNSSPRLGSNIDTSVDISEMPTSENGPTSGSQSSAISQCENGPVSTNQISSKCQDDVCSVEMTSKSQVKQNDDQEAEFSSEDTMVELSMVPVVDYTLKDLKDLVQSLEVKSAKRNKLTITDVAKSILDVYYEGNKQNLVKIEALTELVKTSSVLCIKEMNAVVLQFLETKHLKMLETCFQILRNETTLPSADFRSSWLNVDGQPADVENVLAQPISDYNLTLCKKVSKSVSESFVNVVDSLAQIGTDNAKNLGEHSQKDIPKTTSDNIPEDSVSDCSEATFATTECKTDMILEKGCVDKGPSERSGMQINTKKQFSEQLQDVVDSLKENTPICNEPSCTISYDKCITNNSDIIEKADVSDDADSTNDLPEIMILTPEDARKIFSECAEYDEKREPHQICQEERKDLGTLCVKNHSDLSKVKTNDKFTCPHLTGLACGSDFFCPSCWNETPLIDIESETLFSPKEGELNIDDQRQSCSPQSGKPFEYPRESVCLESSTAIKSITSTQKSDGSDLMRDPNPDDQTQSSSPPPAQEPHEAHTKSSSMIKTVAEDLQKIVYSAGTVSPTKNPSPQTDGVPDADNILIKNTSKHENPSDNRSLSKDDDQCRYKNKESGTFPNKKRNADNLPLQAKRGTPSQMPNASETPKCKIAVSHKQKRPIIKENGHDEQSKERKKVRLELFGSNRRNSSCHDEEKVPLTPVYLTVSPSPNIGKSYQDEPSAKQKVYSQWSSTFIHPQTGSSSCKKIQKHMEDQLKSKIQTLKIALEDRITAILQKKLTEGLKHKQTEDDNYGAQERRI